MAAFIRFRSTCFSEHLQVDALFIKQPSYLLLGIFLFKGNAQFVQKVTFEPSMDFKQNHCWSWKYYKSCYKSFPQLSCENTQLLFSWQCFLIFLRQTLTDDFWRLHKNINFVFPLKNHTKKTDLNSHFHKEREFHHCFSSCFHHSYLRLHSSKTFLYCRNIKILISLKRHFLR